MVAPARRPPPRRAVEPPTEGRKRVEQPTEPPSLPADPSLPWIVGELKNLCQRFVGDQVIRLTLAEALVRLERLPPERVFLVHWVDDGRRCSAAFEHETDADLALQLLGKDVGVKNVAAMHRTYRAFEIGHRKSVRDGALAKLRRAGLSPEEMVALGLRQQTDGKEVP